MKQLYGVVTPLITPLTETDEVDVESLENLTEYLIENGINCLYPNGTTGEMLYFEMEERKLVAETVVKKASGRVPVFIQVGAMNQQQTVELAKHAYEIGADGIGVVTPVFFKLTDKALVDFYTAVAQSVPEDFPVYLYAIPQNAVNDISPETAKNIAEKCKNVIGIKYSYPDFTKLQEFMLINDSRFSVLVGPDHLFQAVVSVGGKGTVSGNAMAVPEHYYALNKALEEGNVELATKLQRRTNILNKILCEKNNIGCYKVVLKNKGIIKTTKMRAPMEEVSPEEQDALMKLLLENQYQSIVL
ncbi:dihydrodipicolinate synthase family protein [Petroclostridium sp. X23]|uniref:dihydrodipicolinate synthase family protein n=1 Tax=Petroclostridium sp. X23 TaxID=3045146 RepID=UPI0024AD07DF|nr:dihydrodipicolinate synthase family protein [Petroclostridium sp. X23]WHH58547.1 dihydrodipicolinate synthase family protein [Petroclostridium sp. X23]